MTNTQYTHRPWAGDTDRAPLQAMLRDRAARLGPPVFPLASDLELWLAGSPNPRVPQDIELWFEGDRLIGYVWPSPGEVDYILHPDAVDATADIFTFAEALTLVGPLEGNTLKAWRFNDDPAPLPFLEAGGYRRSDNFVRQNGYDLRRPLPPMPDLPAGYEVRALAGPHEAASRTEAHLAAFAPSTMTPEKHLRVMQSSLYRLDLDIVAVAPDGAIAAVTIFWYDPILNIGEIEPVGTHPDHQRKGLAAACIVEGMRRLVALGAEWAVINSWRDDSAGSTLYAKLGFEEGRRHEVWARPLPTMARLSAHQADQTKGESMATEWKQAASKQELLDAIQREHDRLVGLVQGLDEATLTRPLVDRSSIKDIIAHITDWETYALQRIRSTAMGEALPLRAPDGNFDAVNDAIYAAHKDRAWHDVWDDFERTHEETVAEIATLSEADIFDPARAEAVIGIGGEAALGHLEGNTANHYWEHANEIEAALAR